MIFCFNSLWKSSPCGCMKQKNVSTIERKKNSDQNKVKNESAGPIQYGTQLRA